MLKFDKSNLDEETIQKQKKKNTFDSPCMSVCDYKGELNRCETCKMLKEEKKLWKIANSKQKQEILKTYLAREF